MSEPVSDVFSAHVKVMSTPSFGDASVTVTTGASSPINIEFKNIEFKKIKNLKRE